MPDTIKTDGINFLKISRGDIWTGYEFEAVVPTLISLSVTKPPNKLSYAVGDDFEPAGMIVTGVYNSGEVKTMTEYEIEGFDTTKTTTCCTVKVKCDDCECSFDIEVLRCLYLYEIVDSSYVTIYMYYGHDKIVSIPSTIEDLPVRIIESTCFNYSDVEKIIVPDTVEIIY